MIEKQYIITGIINIGSYVRLILYPFYPVKEKKILSANLILKGLDQSSLQEEAIFQSIIASHPENILLSREQYLKHEYKLDDIITIKIS